jgi:hypothetical protein
VELTPQETRTYENGANFFSPLGQSFSKSQKRKASASAESRKGGKKKNVALSTLFLLKLGDQMLCPHIIQTASNCGTESY